MGGWVNSILGGGLAGGGVTWKYLGGGEGSYGGELRGLSEGLTSLGEDSVRGDVRSFASSELKNVKQRKLRMKMFYIFKVSPGNELSSTWGD